MRIGMAYRDIPIEKKIKLVCQVLSGEKILPSSRELHVSRPSVYSWIRRAKRSLEIALAPEKRGRKRADGNQVDTLTQVVPIEKMAKERKIEKLRAILGEAKIVNPERGLDYKLELFPLQDMENTIPLVIKRPIKESIFKFLREAIYSGYFLPGTRLIEMELAERFKISRTPIREAFRKLESEGLIQVERNKGAKVAMFSSEDIRSIYAICGALEGIAAYLATPKMGEEEISNLYHLHEEMQKEGIKTQKLTWLTLNRRFHSIYLKKSGSPRLLKLIGEQMGQLERYWFIGLSAQGAIDNHNSHHQKIIEAFRDGIPLMVQKEVQDHFLDSGKMIISFLESASIMGF
jgi:DNA-binding GntR family transcriptional regulator